MKSFFALTLSLALFGALAVQAEDKPQPDKPQTKETTLKRAEIKRTAPVLNGGVLAKYDKNKDGKLDESEREALRKDKETAAKERLKQYDKNGDGKLDEQEKAALRADLQKAHPSHKEAAPAETAPKAPDQK